MQRNLIINNLCLKKKLLQNSSPCSYNRKGGGETPFFMGKKGGQLN